MQINVPQPGRLRLCRPDSLETDMDLLYIGLIAAFIAVSIVLVYGFDKLRGRQ